MALKLKEKNFSNGLVLNNIYCKIGEIGGTKEQINGKIFYYLNEESRLQGKDALDVFYFSFKPDLSEFSKNFFVQSYIYLKENVEDFKNSIDC